MIQNAEKALKAGNKGVFSSACDNLIIDGCHGDKTNNNNRHSYYYMSHVRVLYAVLQVMRYLNVDFDA